jgi:hypothetical protein
MPLDWDYQASSEIQREIPALAHGKGRLSRKLADDDSSACQWLAREIWWGNNMWHTTCFCKLGTTSSQVAIFKQVAARWQVAHKSSSANCQCISTAQSRWREGAHSSLESLLICPACALHVPHSRLAPACTLVLVGNRLMPCQVTVPGKPAHDWMTILSLASWCFGLLDS